MQISISDIDFPSPTLEERQATMAAFVPGLNKRVVVFDIHGLGAQLKPPRLAGHCRHYAEPCDPELEERKTNPCI